MRVAGVADIGGTNTRVALIQEDGLIISLDQFRTPSGTDPAEVPARVRDTLIKLISASGVDGVCGIGVSVAGPVDLKEGTIIHPPNMPFDQVSLVSPLHHFFHCPVTLMNDCRAAVLGEIFIGAGVGFRHVVYVTISTGIGVGIFSDGRVLQGRGGNAGEMGHFPVESTYMHPCSCGHAGHWEGYASGGGIPGFFQAWCRVHNRTPQGVSLTADEILTAASQGDPVALDFVQTLAVINARGLSTLIVAYDPEIIILDGPVVAAHQDLILTPALDHIDHFLVTPDIVISPLGGRSPLFGMASAVFSSL